MTEIDEGISHVRHFHQHVMHELILVVSFPTNISYKCVMFQNVFVQYKCTVSNRIGLPQPQFENITS